MRALMNEWRPTSLAEPPTHLDELAHRVIGSAIEVHRVLGPGFLESVYEEALLIELASCGIRVRRQVEIPIHYKGSPLTSSFIDVLVDEVLVVELKSVEQFAQIHMAQTLSYLKAGGFQLGLLINFNAPQLRQGVRRVIWNGRHLPITSTT